MSANVIYKLAIVLTKSQLRATQRNKLVARLFGDPRSIIIVDALLLLGVGTLGYVLLSMNWIAGFADMIRNIESEGLAGVPTSIAFAVIVLGVLYEISQPLQSMSTDLVNWLPISSTEYVAGSVVSEAYLYSFMLSLFLGVLLGPALYFGLSLIWVAAALMAVIALLTGSCVVEILDAVTNRISSSFYKRSGRSGIIFRLGLTIIILVFVQLIFSGQIAGYLIRSIVHTVQVAWYVPMVWPSVSVLSLSQGSIMNSIIFGALSIGFTLTLFQVAVMVRARYWVPVPVSVRLSTQTYLPSESRVSIPGLGSVELALLRKDFRSILRRREMARFMAIPFVLAASIGLSLITSHATSDSVNFVTILPLYIIPVTIFAQMLAMTSIGSEGYAVWNLYAAPIRPSQLLRAKLIYAITLGIIFCVGMAIFFSILVNSALPHLWVLMIVGIVTVLEQSAIGITIGARFPDFREMVRSRYVSIWASLLGLFVGLFISFLTISPIFLSIHAYQRFLNQFTILSLGLGLIAFLITWKIAERQIESLLRNIRT
ncbi:MAG TPA: hypothetical protein VK503_05930 [Candidatus Bathyarchaeia archaeon]|nr:hypothetical protein [Candidatus Bathyarchaeia archaeon]